MAGRERPDAPLRLWQVDEDGSKPRGLEMGGLTSWAVAPDGRHVAAKTKTDTITVVPLDDGPTRGDPAAGRRSAREPVERGRPVSLPRASARLALRDPRLDLATEKVELWKQVAPPDATGMLSCSGILPSADGRIYVYGTNRSLASLIVAEGLR